MPGLVSDTRLNARQNCRLQSVRCCRPCQALRTRRISVRVTALESDGSQDVGRLRYPRSAVDTRCRHQYPFSEKVACRRQHSQPMGNPRVVKAEQDGLHPGRSDRRHKLPHGSSLFGTFRLHICQPIVYLVRGSPIPTAFLAALAIAAVASFIAYVLAARALPRSAWLQKIGDKLHEQKMAQLGKPPLNWYQGFVEQNRFISRIDHHCRDDFAQERDLRHFRAGRVVLPATRRRHHPGPCASPGDQPGLKRWAAQVTFMQTLSHLIAACVGFGATWLWLGSDTGFLEILGSAPAFTWSMSLPPC